MIVGCFFVDIFYGYVVFCISRFWCLSSHILVLGLWF